MIRGHHDSFQYKLRTVALAIDERGKGKLLRIRVYDLLNFTLNFEKKSSLLFIISWDFVDLRKVARFSTTPSEFLELYNTL